MSKPRIRRLVSGRTNLTSGDPSEAAFLNGAHEKPLLAREQRESKSKLERAQVARLLQTLNNNLESLDAEFRDADPPQAGRVPPDQVRAILGRYEDAKGQGAVEGLLRMLRVQPREPLDYGSFMVYVKRNKGNVILGDRSKAGFDGFMTVAPWEQRGSVHYQYANAKVQDNTGGLLKNPKGSVNQELADTAVVRKVMDAMRRHRRRLEKLFRVEDRAQLGSLDKDQFLKTLGQVGIGIDPALCSRAFELLVPDESRGERLEYERLVDRLDNDPFRAKVPLPSDSAALASLPASVLLASAAGPAEEKLTHLRRRLAAMDTTALEIFKKNDVNYDGRLSVALLQRALKTVCPEFSQADTLGLYRIVQAEHEALQQSKAPAAREPLTYRHLVRMLTQEPSPIEPDPTAPGFGLSRTGAAQSPRRAASARPAAAGAPGGAGTSSLAALSIGRPTTSVPTARTGNNGHGAAPFGTLGGGGAGGAGGGHGTVSSPIAAGPAGSTSLQGWAEANQDVIAAAPRDRQQHPGPVILGGSMGMSMTLPRAAASGREDEPPPFTFGRHLALPTWQTSIRPITGAGLVKLRERPGLNESAANIMAAWAVGQEPHKKFGRSVYNPPLPNTFNNTVPLEGTSGYETERFAPRDASIKAMQDADRTRKSFVQEGRCERRREYQRQLEERKASDEVATDRVGEARVDAKRVQNRRFHERVSLYDRIIEQSQSGLGSGETFFATSH